MFIAFGTPFQSVDEKQNIIILCFDVNFTGNHISPIYEAESYNNLFKFSAKTLSIEDKTIYMVIPANKSHLIIPMIYKHYCIEKIYLYGSPDMESSYGKASMFENTSDCYANINELYNQIINDIEITRKRLLQWDRSFDLFTMLYTQQLENKYSIIEGSSDILYKEFIVIFYCDSRRVIHIEETLAPIRDFTNVEECIQLINQEKQSQIFLVISGSALPLEIQQILDCEHIHAIYFFRHNEIKYPINERKVSGVFDQLAELSQQLCKDILFYREQHMHTSRIDVCPKINHEKMYIKELNDDQIHFLKLKLFIDILPKVPLLKFTVEDLISIRDLLFPNKRMNNPHYLEQLHEAGNYTQNFDQDPKLLQTISRLHQLNKLNELFVMQESLINIHKRVQESNKISTPITIYLIRLISADALKELIKLTSSDFINIGITIIANRSLLTARYMARKMVDNGLISILCHINVMKDTHVLELDSSRVILPSGVLFRFESINRAPDGVYYVKIKSADSEFQLLKEQIQFEIRVPLSWLTYGNYLYFLNRSEQAKTYFEYLLGKLPPENIHRSSIYNNMALIYTMENGDDGKIKAQKIYEDALKCALSITHNSIVDEHQDQTCNSISTVAVTLSTTSVDRSTVLARMAKSYHQEGDYKSALDYYKQALELSNDLRYRTYYRHMIENVKNDAYNSAKLMLS